jgi:hypothetical protein
MKPQNSGNNPNPTGGSQSGYGYKGNQQQGNPPKGYPQQKEGGMNKPMGGYKPQDSGKNSGNSGNYYNKKEK